MNRDRVSLAIVMALADSAGGCGPGSLVLGVGEQQVGGADSARMPVRWISAATVSSSIRQAVMSLTRRACCMLWVTTTIVKSALRSSIRSSTRAVDIGSRADRARP